MFKRIICTLACISALAALQGSAFGAIVTLKNGDRLTGTILSQADGVITLKTDHLGTLQIPQLEATVELTEADQGVASTEAAKADAAAKTDAESQADAAAAEEIAQQTEELDAFDAMMHRAQKWVQQWVPAGWSGRFNLGYQFAESNSRATSWTIGANASKDSGIHHYSINAYYDYKNSINAAGVQDKQIDKWGAGFKYRRDFDDNFFFLANSSYLHDQVKQIRHEFTQDIGIGYYFFNTPEMVLYVAPAFSPQYKDAAGVSKKWFYMASLLQEFKYKLSQNVALEQNAQGSIEPNDTDNYSYKFKIAIITKLTDWVDLVVAYNLNYDNNVGSGATKREQMASVSLGIPF